MKKEKNGKKQFLTRAVLNAALQEFSILLNINIKENTRVKVNSKKRNNLNQLNLNFLLAKIPLKWKIIYFP